MTVIRLSSADDPRLDDYRNLTDVNLRRAVEPREGLYMAEGSKVIERALAAGHKPRSMLLSEKWLEPTLGALGERADGLTVYVAPEEALAKVTGYAVHRGALAAMQRPPLPSVAEVLAQARTVVVLDGLVDHTNVGAIFRSVAGLGADAVLISPTCADPLYRRSVKVSMGTVFQVPWTRVAPWPEGLDELRDEGFVVAALALSEGAVPLDAFARERPAKVALVLGAEGDGLAPAVQNAADAVVTIPMAGGVDSLNVAAASAVALWALTPRPVS